VGLYKPSQLFDFLDKAGARPKKALSQNFLIDQNILNKLIAFADLKQGECVLEIGPGPGVITQKLLKAGAFVIAVEKDRTFAKELRRLGPEKDLTVIEGDVLDIDIEALFKKKPFKVIANLPYSLTTPILVKLLASKSSLISMTTFVQKEYADRLCAQPNTKNYSSLSVFANFYSTPFFGFKVSPSSFIPKPKVVSAVVKLVPHRPLHMDEKRFFEITRKAFGQRRKMLRASLAELWGKERITDALEKIGALGTARPEDLSANNFVRLLDALLAS